MHKKTALDLVVLILLIVGAVNWGLVGLMNINIVSSTLGDGTMLAKVVYAIIGLSGLYAITWLLKKD